MHAADASNPDSTLETPSADHPTNRAHRPVIAVDPAQLEGIAWRTLFGNDAPVELEIGTGKAAFLLRRAQANPHRNFFGIEWANEFYKFAVDRFERWRVPNVRMVRADASHFIRRHCPRATLAVIHVYHPDPWPKKRHHRRRLFQPAFVESAIDCLISGGRLSVQTDHSEYFEIIHGLLTKNGRLREVPFDDPAFGVESARVATNFEVKYIREGREIYQIAVVRTDTPPNSNSAM